MKKDIEIDNKFGYKEGEEMWLMQKYLIKDGIPQPSGNSFFTKPKGVRKGQFAKTKATISKKKVIKEKKEAFKTLDNINIGEEGF